ncbi:hypothetical protein PIB30_069787, partial [Stylosanthes scabra]|nr:hypothetical protein [Stylosanthes scabra]
HILAIIPSGAPIFNVLLWKMPKNTAGDGANSSSLLISNGFEVDDADLSAQGWKATGGMPTAATAVGEGGELSVNLSRARHFCDGRTSLFFG